MSNFFTHPRDYFLVELEKRQTRNASYSLRAFARDLSLAPSTLSEVIKGRYGLSEKKIPKVAQALNLNEEESGHFIDLFQRTFGKKRQTRRLASSRAHTRQKTTYQSLPLDEFKAVSDWYHFALLEWISLKGGKISQKPATIRKTARLLDLSPEVVNDALKRLERLGQVVAEDNHWVVVDAYTATGNEVPSEAIQRFHQQIMTKASQAVVQQPMADREFSAAIFSFSKEDLVEAKKAIRDFNREFAERFTKPGKGEEIRALSLQFFSLSPGAHGDSDVE